MTPRELVYRTLNFEKPERIPRHLWKLPWADIHYPEDVNEIVSRFPDDIVSPPVVYKDPPLTRGNPYAAGHYVDEWGCEFHNLQEGVIGEVKTPLIKDWADLGRLRPPTELLFFDKEKINRFCSETDCFVMASALARPFERMQWLRTTEQFFVDMALSPDMVKKMGDLVHGFYLKEMECWCQTDVDAVFFMDDWGTQNALLVSPSMWRDMFLGYYRDYIELAHSYNKKIFFHSDGYIKDIIPDLIKLKLDAINSQVFCMDPVDLGRQFKGQITFWGEMDRQYLLPFGSSEDIDRAVSTLMDSFYTNGGYIAQCEFGPGVNPVNVKRYFGNPSFLGE